MGSTDGETRREPGEDPTPVGTGIERNRLAARVRSLLELSPTPTETMPAVGRFVVRERIGSGGMGVVYSAHDPELDRTVALKVLRADGGGIGSQLSRARFQREARAIAQLTHPNVVAIYDVGTHKNRVYMACEYVDGPDLGEWLATPRPRRDILDVFIQCANGLLAAHEKDLVHRDFKPSNVMLGSDGRVRVLDFGLARTVDGTTGEQRGTAEGEGGAEIADSGTQPQRSVDVELTAAGTVMGTPAYMAPEQVRAQPIGPATDQFSFCVALWEAVYGQRPFAGEDARSLAGAIVRDEPVLPATAKTSGDRGLHRALLRGLSKDPSDRFSSMRDLIAVLERGRASRWPRRAAALAIITAIGLAVGAWAMSRGETCPSGSSLTADSWNADRAAALQEGFERSGLGYASDAAVSVDRAMRAYATTWNDEFDQTCALGPEAVVRKQCLDSARAQFDGMAAALLSARPEFLEQGLDAIESLPRPTDCRAPGLSNLPPPEASQVVEVQQIRVEMARARARVVAYDFEAGLAGLEGLVERASALDYAPLRAEVLVEFGHALSLSGEPGRAEETLFEAIESAERIDHVSVAARAWLHLVSVVGLEHKRYDEGLRLARPARAAIEKSGRPRLQLRLDRAVGEIHLKLGNYPKALATLRQSAELAETEYQGPAMDRVMTTLGLARVHRELGNYDEAMDLAGQARDMTVALRGERHPSVARSLSVLVTTMAMTDADPEGQLRLWRRILQINEDAVGPEHPETVTALHGVGMQLSSMGRHAEAIPHLERAIAIDEKTYGKNQPQSVPTLYALSLSLLAVDRVSEARALAQKGLTIIEPVIGEDHPDLSYPLEAIGTVAYREGRVEEAEVAFTRGLANLERGFGPDHARVVKYLADWADAALAGSEVEQAELRAAQAIERGRSIPSAAGHVSAAETTLAELRKR